MFRFNMARLNVHQRCFVILDRDGVINVDLPTGCRNIHAFQLLPHTSKAIRLLNDKGIFPHVATNQGLVGRGDLSIEGLEQIHQHMVALLAEDGAKLGSIHASIDTHIPPNFTRKPAPGLLFDAMKIAGYGPHETLFVGDAQRDMDAALQAGCQGILVRTGKGKKTEKAWLGPESHWAVFDSLYHVAESLCQKLPQ